MRADGAYGFVPPDIRERPKPLQLIIGNAIDGFLDSPDVRANPSTLRAYTGGTDTAHLLPRLIAGRERGPLFLLGEA